MIHFTRHFSRLAAEKHYGDLGGKFRGHARSDFDLTVYAGKEELERDLAADYDIDYKAKTIKQKETK